MTKSQSDFNRGVGWGAVGWRQDVRSGRVPDASHVRPWVPGQRVWISFGHAVWLAGSYFLDQGLNLVPVVKVSSSNHWTAKEVPKQILCFGS